MNEPEASQAAEGPSPSGESEGEAAPMSELFGYLQTDPDAEGDLRDWVLGLERWSDEACVVAAVAVGRLLVARGIRGDEVPPPEALAASEFLVRWPDLRAEREARKAWAREAGWGLEVEWSELAAEVAWRAHNTCGLEETLGVLRERLGEWAQRRQASEA